MSQVIYGSPNSVLARGPSPSIWADCPVNTFLKDPGKGMHIFEDFRNSIVLKETASASDFTSSVGRIAGDMNWYVFCETTKLVDCALQADDIGVLKLLTEGSGADQDVNCIVSGNNVIGSIRTPKVGETKKFWFEARVFVNTIANADLGMFVGLAQPGEAKDTGGVFAGDAAALASIDYVGFAILEGDGNDIIIAYNEAGAGSVKSSTGLITPVASAYIRLGMKLVFDGNSTKFRFFADGVDLGDAAAVDVGSTNVDWPGDTNMDITISLITGSGGSSDDTLAIDWVRIAQEY